MLETVIFIQFLSVLLLVSLRKLENLEIFFFKKNLIIAGFHVKFPNFDLRESLGGKICDCIWIYIDIVAVNSDASAVVHNHIFGANSDEISYLDAIDTAINAENLALTVLWTANIRACCRIVVEKAI